VVQIVDVPIVEFQVALPSSSSNGIPVGSIAIQASQGR
jgi:hypothetical protein